MTEKFYPREGSTQAANDVDVRELFCAGLIRRAGVVPKGFINPAYTAFVFGQELYPYADSTGLSVKVKAGIAIVEGMVYYSDTQQVLSIGTADATNPRIDAVVVEYKLSESPPTATLKILAGTPAASPSIPALTKTGTTFHVILGYVWVGAGVVTIDATDVVDNRVYCSGQRTLSLTIGGNDSALYPSTVVFTTQLQRGMHISQVNLIGDASGTLSVDLRSTTNAAALPLSTTASNIGTIALSSAVRNRILTDAEAFFASTANVVGDFSPYILEAGRFLSVALGATITTTKLFTLSIVYYDLGGD